jgi:hypothetical protein
LATSKGVALEQALKDLGLNKTAILADGQEPPLAASRWIGRELEKELTLDRNLQKEHCGLVVVEMGGIC